MRSAGPGSAEKATDPALPEYRGLTSRDLPGVLAIERRCFRAPWSPAMFHVELGRPDVVALAAEVAGRLVGYSVLARLPDAWHLMNVAVDPAHRRRGIGSGLVVKSLVEAGPDVPVTLEVRASNRPAIALYRELGFRPAGTRPGYYPDDGEDALVMWKGDPVAAGVPAEALGAS